jgi:hypothetical protein
MSAAASSSAASMPALGVLVRGFFVTALRY